MIIGLAIALMTVGLPTEAISGIGGRRRDRMGDVMDPADYFDAVARELRSGSSLRHSLARPVPESRLARLAMTGQHFDWVTTEVVAVLDLDDDLVGAAVRLASRTGAPASKVFERLAERARLQKQHRRDRAAATAQARLSAAVVGLLPLGLGAAALALGGGRYLAESGPARTAMMFGGALQLLGLLAIVVILRREG